MRNQAYPRILKHDNSLNILKIRLVNDGIAFRRVLSSFFTLFFGISAYGYQPISQYMYSDSLPWQITLGKINQHIPNRLKIVSSAFFDSQMSIDGSIPGSSREIFILFIRNMLMSFCISIFFTQSKINKIDDM